MISTVTTSTVTTVTTGAFAGTLALLAIVALLLLLIQKEIVSTSDDARLQAINRSLNIAIVPLLLAFIFTAGVKVIQILY
jgi:chromate transport protein ChrA